MIKTTLSIINRLAIAASAFAAHPLKPDVIFILTDDQRYDSLSMTSHPVTKTPNVDRLAKEGLSFRKARTEDTSA